METVRKNGFHFNLLILTSTVAVIMNLVLANDPCSEALLSLKSEIIDDSKSLQDWSIPDGDNHNPSGKIIACSWSGVKCNKNSTIIVGLNLSGKNLGGILSGKQQFSVFAGLIDLNISGNSFSGLFPAKIFNLTNLRNLDISRNNFSGHFPEGVSGLRSLVVLDAFSNSFSGPLPIELPRLENLKVLNLAGSYFSDSIPSQYGYFKSLEFLHLGGNFLSGEIPAELGLLKTVTHMEIGYNSYHGMIPRQLGNMTELKYLDIADANLSGSIPKELSNLTKLESLFLFRNQFMGPIPWDLGKIMSLVSLDLSDNQISGPIPESFAELKNLRLLSLMYNEMSGTVPEGIAELPELETLFIWNNFFFGSLPKSLGKHSRLRWVDVSTNDFTGSIPEDICSNGALFKLMLFSNKFSGSLSPSLSNCSTLVRLRLEDNAFSGVIPLNFSQLRDISYIDLSRNNFTGGIPHDMFKASNLQYLNVSNNPGLGGVIPPEIWSMPLLQNFSAFSCGIFGNLPGFSSCNSLSVIELQNNNISGTISQSVSICQALQRMDLEGNNFIGHIPQELSSLPLLNDLDLSHNNFSGSIPPGKFFRTMGRNSYVGNPELCGAPLTPCRASMAILGSKGTKKLTSVLVLCSVLTLFIVAAVLGLFYICRGNQGRWKMISFAGLPHFTAKDVLRSFNSPESAETVLPRLSSASMCKAVLPTGIIVTVKKIELEAKKIRVVSKFITRMGNARHKNLIRLLGFCYNNHIGYLLYDYLPNGNLTEKMTGKRDWAAKYRIVLGVAKGLHFLHHDCYPAIPHGELKSGNILFDENMEPHLAEFGFKYLMQLNKGLVHSRIPTQQTDLTNDAIKEELYMDIFNFGELIMEIATNGRLMNAGATVQDKPKDSLLREIYSENGIDSNGAFQEEVKRVLEVALLCTRSSQFDRPCMEDALKLLSGPNSKRT